MRNVLAFFCCWLGLILQATVLQVPPLSLIQPNIVVVLLILVALTRGPRVALILGVLTGFIQDVNYSSFIGLNAFAYGFVGYFAGAVLSQFIQRSVAIAFITCVTCTFVYDWMTYGMTRLFDVTSYSWHGVMSISLLQMMLNGILLLVLYPLCVRWFASTSENRYGDTGQRE